jgi:hypothetical protein
LIIGKRINWRNLLVILFLVVSASSFSQKKNVSVDKLKSGILMDGWLNDKGWEDASVIEDFVSFQPVSGNEPSLRTKVKIGYDAEAFYFGAMLYDNPDSMRKRLTLRDNIDADNFIFHFSPFNDGTSWFEFWTTCTGVQQDVFIEPTGRNRNWDAVWESKVNIVDSGWIAEIRVPFNVLRIPTGSDQVWGFNMFRQVKWKNQVISWNLMNPDGPAGTYFYSTQQGEIHGIKDIDPGKKLWLWPYGSMYSQSTSGNGLSKPIFQAGMDVKYGINESFNLDMILIPDFNQVRTDDKILNLTPFEIYYNEQRQFFYEGSDLFNKAGVFYSRRIGSSPVGNRFLNSHLEVNEEVESQTETTRILNATKITGRTEKGLGIGFLNAITANEYARIQDTLTGVVRNLKTQPLTNHNVMVADQTFGNNSYLTVINTNLFRKLTADETSVQGSNYIANVLAVDSKIYTGDFATTVYAAQSYKPVNDRYTSGYYYNLQFEKDKGELRFLASRKLYSINYDPNDMGYLKNNNIASNTVSFSYNINKPFGHFLTFLNTLAFNQTSQVKPREFADFSIIHTFSSKLANQWTLALLQQYRPVDSYDFYEPRTPGRYFIRPEFYNVKFDIVTDKNKAVAVGSGVLLQWMGNNTDSKIRTLPLSIWVKVNNRLSFGYLFTDTRMRNDHGFAGMVNGNDIYFTIRDVSTIENVIEASYIFSPISAFDLRARHYYSSVDYNQFLTLNDNGTLIAGTAFSADNFYYDALTADFSYIWRFKPGSNLSILLRRQVYNNFSHDSNYRDALTQTLKSAGVTSISIKLLYYIDYNHIIKKGA